MAEKLFFLLHFLFKNCWILPALCAKLKSFGQKSEEKIGHRKSYCTSLFLSGGEKHMKNYYDIAIIGGGIGGLMTAWR